MKMYKDKTDGSYIEEKESTIIWNHNNAEYEFGKLQAKELKTYLKNVFEHLPIETYETKNTVQVVPQELKNDKLVRTLLEQEIKKKRNGLDQADKYIDFILYIGD